MYSFLRGRNRGTKMESENVTLIIFGMVLLICVISYTRGKANRKKSSANYRNVIAQLVEVAKKHYGEKKFEKMEVTPFLSDDNHSYLICENRDADIFSVVTPEEVHDMKCSEHKTCDIVIDGDEKSFSSVRCVIRPESEDYDLTLILGNKKHRRKSYFGKFILSNAEEVRNLVLGRETE